MRAEQGWCSLCYASVEPAFDPLTAPLDEVEGRYDEPVDTSATEPDVLSVPPVQSPAPVPSLTPHVDQPAQTTPPVSDVDVMLSMLAAEHRQNDPAVGLAERLGDKSTRIAVMFGGMLLIGVVGFLLLTVLGAIF